MSPDCTFSRAANSLSKPNGRLVCKEKRGALLMQHSLRENPGWLPDLNWQGATGHRNLRSDTIARRKLRVASRHRPGAVRVARKIAQAALIASSCVAWDWDEMWILSASHLVTGPSRLHGKRELPPFKVLASMLRCNSPLLLVTRPLSTHHPSSYRPSIRDVTLASLTSTRASLTSNESLAL